MKLKQKIKGFYKVEVKEIVKGKKKKFAWQGSKNIIPGAKVYEMNPETMGFRQVVKIPITVSRVDVHKLFSIPFWRSFTPTVTKEMRYNWKDGMVYTQGASKKSVQKKFKKFLDTQLAVIQRNSKK